MRSKLLNKKTKSRLVKMAVMVGYVVMYYLTQYVAGIIGWTHINKEYASPAYKLEEVT